MRAPATPKIKDYYMIKLWISDKLELRWNEWPEMPKAYVTSDDETLDPLKMEIERYNESIAKAKAESILADGIHVPYPKADSFIDFVGSIEVVYQALQGDFWADIIPKYYEEMKNKHPERFHQRPTTPAPAPHAGINLPATKTPTQQTQ